MIIWYRKENLLIMKRKFLLMSLILLISSYFTINVCALTTDVEVKLDQNEYSGLGDRVKVQIKAPNLNIHKYSTDQLEIQVSTSEDAKGYSVLVQETKDDSGIFEVMLPFSLSGSGSTNRSLKVKTGSKIYIKYKDIIKEAVWKPDDAVIKLDKSTCYGYGAQALVTLDDNDLNLNPNLKEEINVIVKSTSDPVGISVKLLEKSTDSGIFTGNFGFDLAKSDAANSRIKIAYNGTVTVTYNDIHNISGKTAIRTCSSTWKPATGTVKFGKSSYTGLLSKASITLNDQDLNLRSSYIDTTRIRITSNSDPNGLFLTLYETGTGTGVFTNSFSFSSSTSDNSKGVLRISAKDTIIADYKDAVNSENIYGKAVTATAAFQLTEAVIETSAENDSGAGNVLDITITEPDANNPGIKDTIIAKVGSGNSSDDLTIYLQETGNNTGKFKFSLYFTEGTTNGQLLNMSGSDKINIKYVDQTVPQGGTKEIVKTINWKYQSSILSLDKEVYTGYNTSAKVSLFNMDLNDDSNKVEYIDVDIETGKSKSIRLKLKETKASSGNFTGTLYFGRTSNSNNSTIKMSGNDSITVSYTSETDEDDVVECYADWSPHDGEITLNKEEYCGKEAPVVITLKDWDIADNSKAKDEVKVLAKIPGTSKTKYVTLTETNRNTGIFTGTLYINGGKSPSLKINPGDKIEVEYTDEDTTSGSKQDITTNTAVWTGISVATLTLDQTQYKGYDTYMTITLSDPDGNKYPAARDSVEVTIKTSSSSTGKKYTLRETGVNTGVFTLKLKLTKEAATSKTVRVSDSDQITVTLSDKNVSAKAGFAK